MHLPQNKSCWENCLVLLLSTYCTPSCYISKKPLEQTMRYNFEQVCAKLGPNCPFPQKELFFINSIHIFLVQLECIIMLTTDHANNRSQKSLEPFMRYRFCKFRPTQVQLSICSNRVTFWHIQVLILPTYQAP